MTIHGGTKYGVEFSGCPEDLPENGGLGSIAEQLALAKADVILGGGTEHFVAQYEMAPSPLELAKRSA